MPSAEAASSPPASVTMPMKKLLAGLLWIAGVILERVRLLRVYQTRTVYSQFSKLDGLE
jgi:hypothetical protein